MRRYVAIGAAVVALTYFLDPKKGRRRREAVRAWVTETAHRIQDRVVGMPMEEPVETPGNGRAPVSDEEPEPVWTEAPLVGAPIGEPAAVGMVAAPESEQAPEAEGAPAAVAVAEQPVAVAEQPVAEAALPPPLPHDVFETPALEPELEEPEPAAVVPRKKRGWLISGTVLLAAVLAAGAGLAAWSLDVIEFSDDEPTSVASELNDLAERQARAISILAQPGSTRIPVTGAEERLLLIVGAEGDAVLIVSRLDPAPAGKTYEIWVITGKTPSPAGLFRGGTDTVVPLTRAVPEGATVALTLEPVGGSPQPTTEPIYAVSRS